MVITRATIEIVIPMYEIKVNASSTFDLPQSSCLKQISCVYITSSTSNYSSHSRSLGRIAANIYSILYTYHKDSEICEVIAFASDNSICGPIGGDTHTALRAPTTSSEIPRNTLLRVGDKLPKKERPFIL